MGPAVLASCTGVAVCLAGLASLQDAEAPPAALGVSLMCVFMLTFEIALAPAAFVLGTECYPLELRGKALSLSMFTTRTVSGLVAVVFPSVVAILSLKFCLWGFFVSR